MPNIPPLVIALLPTRGDDNAALIHGQHLDILRLAANASLQVVTFAADGAASELSGQNLMDGEQTDLPPVTYDYDTYGIHLRAPVYRITGPLVSVTDAPHAAKTVRNQPQHGTHTASLGRSFIVSRSLIDLYELEDSGLCHSDVQNVDKQDDGAARRMFHHVALKAMTNTQPDGEQIIKDGFAGLFVYLFVSGMALTTYNCIRLLMVA